MLERAVRKELSVKALENVRDLQEHPLVAQLVQDRNEHVLLPVYALSVARFIHVKTARALANAQIIEHGLPIHVLLPRFIGSALHGEGHVEIIIDAADGVDQFLDRGHGDRIIVIDRNIAEHPRAGLANLVKAGAVDLILAVRVLDPLSVFVFFKQAAAAVERCVQLVQTLHAGDLCVGVARQGDHIHGLLVKVDRKHDHHVRMLRCGAAGFEPFLREPLLGVVHAHEQNVHDVLHHGCICLLLQRVIIARRGRRCDSGLRGRAALGGVLRGRFGGRFGRLGLRGEIGRRVVPEISVIEKPAETQRNEKRDHGSPDDQFFPAGSAALSSPALRPLCVRSGPATLFHKPFLSVFDKFCFIIARNCIRAVSLL